MSHKDAGASHFYTKAYEWQLDRMFGIWNSAVQDISNWIQVARSERSIMILNKVYKAFFHCEDFLHWAYRPDQILLAMFMLALKIDFERALYPNDEGYETDDDYDLPQPLNKPTNIYAVQSVATPYFNYTDYQKPTISTSLTTPKERPGESQLHWWSVDD